MEIKTQLKAMGGSLGINTAIPKDFIIANNLSKDQEITIEIKAPSKAGALFGLFSNWKISTKELHKETDNGWKDD